MKSLPARLMLAALMAAVVLQADAQTRTKTTNTTRKPTTTARKPTTTTTRKPTAQKTNTKAADSNLVVKAVDTMPKVVEQPRELLKLDSVRKSMRSTSSIVREQSKDRTPLAYEHIREDDATYVQIVWRELDVREKMNQAFRYRADEDEGNQRFISILLEAIRDGEITAFDAGVTGTDDRFTTPITLQKIGEVLVGKCKTEQVPDWVKDPMGQKGILKDTTICPMFNPDEIVKYMIKEEWIFDKESSRMFARINGIAPIKISVDENTGTVLGETPAFWVYYPDLRPVLARKDVYNGKNFGGRMSWEELFESRFFSSNIVKSTIENPYDQYIRQYIKDPILRLLEGDNIKEKIFNFEQDLWSY
jgi:gliding motility associated protien GldN